MSTLSLGKWSISPKEATSARSAGSSQDLWTHALAAVRKIGMLRIVEIKGLKRYRREVNLKGEAMEQPITFEAIFQKATTTVDGGWRISFDLSNDDSSKVSDIAALANESLTIVVMTSGYVAKDDA